MYWSPFATSKSEKIMKNYILLLWVLTTLSFSQKVVLQQGLNGYEGCKDAIVSHDGVYSIENPDFLWMKNTDNYGNLPYLSAHFCPSCGDMFTQSVIEFDIPEGVFDASVKSAVVKLKLTHIDQLLPHNKSLIYPITTEWIEDEISYLKPFREAESWGYSFTSGGITVRSGCDFNRDFKVLSSDHLLKDSWVEFDVTDIVNAQLRGEKTFYGFVIAEGFVKEGAVYSGHPEEGQLDTIGSFNNAKYYYSSEHDSISFRPKLEITYDDVSVVQNMNTIAVQNALQFNNNQLHITNIYAAKATVLIYGIDGKVVSEVGDIAPKDTLHYSVAGLAKGVYVVMVQSGAGKFAQKIVIQ